MATVTRVLGIANGGLVELDLTYDDVTAVIASISLTNNGVAGTMTATLFDRTTGAVILGPTSETFGTGTTTQDLAKLNLSMVAVPPDKFSPDGWATPFAYLLQWSSS